MSDHAPPQPGNGNVVAYRVATLETRVDDHGKRLRTVETEVGAAIARLSERVDGLRDDVTAATTATRDAARAATDAASAVAAVQARTSTAGAVARYVGAPLLALVFGVLLARAFAPPPPPVQPQQPAAVTAPAPATLGAR